MEKFHIQLKQKLKKMDDKFPLLSLAVLPLLVLVMIPTQSEARRRPKKTYFTGTSVQTTQSSTSTGSSTTQVNTSTNLTPTPTPTSTPTPTTTPTSVTSSVNTGSGTVSSTSPTISSNIPFLNNLVGYWKLNGSALSAIGKDNGTPFGNVTYVPGKFGQAAHFDGKSYIEIPDRDYFSPSTTGQKTTVSFWFKPDNYDFTGINQGYVNFLGKADWDSGANIEWEFRLYNNTAYDGFSRSRRLSFYAFNKEGGLGTGSALNNAAPLNVWTHITGVIDGTNTKFYVNGKLVDQDPLSGYNINMSNTSAPLRIGTSDKDSFLQGSISNLMIYNRNLTDAEVYQLFQTDLSK